MTKWARDQQPDQLEYVTDGPPKANVGKPITAPCHRTQEDKRPWERDAEKDVEPVNKPCSHLISTISGRTTSWVHATMAKIAALRAASLVNGRRRELRVEGGAGIAAIGFILASTLPRHISHRYMLPVAERTTVVSIGAIIYAIIAALQGGSSIGSIATLRRRG